MPSSKRLSSVRSNIEKDLVKDLGISWKEAKVLTEAAKKELGKDAHPHDIFRQAKFSVHNESHSANEQTKAILADLDHASSQTSLRNCQPIVALEEKSPATSMLCHCF
mmetsp:Transcript_20765/g.34336  ORF Transcript_20765/g.34336 Transcript_20765/m.34336 type:complete len:108 (+) Transcript_20765:133-456(+)